MDTGWRPPPPTEALPLDSADSGRRLPRAWNGTYGFTTGSRLPPSPMTQIAPGSVLIQMS
jgi:hypothetical protein